MQVKIFSLARAHRKYSIAVVILTQCQNKWRIQTLIQMFWVWVPKVQMFEKPPIINCWQCSLGQLAQADHRLCSRANGGQCSPHSCTVVLCQERKYKGTKASPFHVCRKDYQQSKNNFFQALKFLLKYEIRKKHFFISYTFFPAFKYITKVYINSNINFFTLLEF